VAEYGRRLPPAERHRLEQLAERIGHEFDDLTLLGRALAHRSWCAETPGEASNERLEFLGDAVLGWAVADMAYREFGELPEGLLTDLRKSVVNSVALAQVAQQIGLGPHIRLGKGEAAAGGAEKPSILSDAFEAVLAAVYLDGGAGAAFEMVERLVAPRMTRSVDRLDQLDHKTQLQELAARLGRGAPEYRLSSIGPDHAKTFTAEAVVDGAVIGLGTGRSKKAAEQGAAAQACDALAGEG
jgi:ribonuclease-3